MANKSTIIQGIEMPTASDLKPVTPISELKPPKKSATIREADNGWIIEVFAGEWHEEWVVLTLNKLLRTVAAFLQTNTEE